MKHATLVLAFAAAVGLVGCAQRVGITRTRPATVNLAPATRLVIAPLLRSYSWRREYTLQPGDLGDNVTHQKLLDVEVESLATHIAQEVTPYQYADHVQLDDRGNLVDPAIERIKASDFDGAHALLTALVLKYPKLAPAYYNLGVIEEARGELDAARALYSKAQQFDDQSLYGEGVARIDRVKAELQALAGAATP